MAAAALVIGDADRVTLESWSWSWSWSRSIRASYVERGRIVLAVADGKGTSGTAREVGVSRPTVIKWRDRFAQLGIAGLADEPRPGPPEDGRRLGDHRRDAGAATAVAGGDALVEPVAGQAPRDRGR